jgi:hypothetical protein
VILFQILALALLALLIIRGVLRLMRGAQPRRTILASIAVYAAAALAIQRPDITMLLAHKLGIGRGADLVLYVFVIAFIFSMFYVFNQFVELRSEITALVRQLAIRDAEKQDQKPSGEDAVPPPETRAAPFSKEKP